MPEMNI